MTLAIARSDDGLAVAVRERRGGDPSLLPDSLALVRRAPLDVATPGFVAAVQAHLDTPACCDDGLRTTAGALLGPDPAAALAQVAEVVRSEVGDRALLLGEAHLLLVVRLFESFEMCGAQVTDGTCVASARRRHPSPDEVADAALADAFDAPVPEAFADVLEGTWMPARPLASEGTPTLQLRAADGELEGVLTLAWAPAPLQCRGPRPGPTWTRLSCIASWSEGDAPGAADAPELSIRFAGSRLEVRPLGSGWVRDEMVLAPAWLVLHRIDALALAFEVAVRGSRSGGGVESLQEMAQAVVGEHPAARSERMYAALARALDASAQPTLTLRPAHAEHLAGLMLLTLGTTCAPALSSEEPARETRAEAAARFDACIEGAIPSVAAQVASIPFAE